MAPPHMVGVLAKVFHMTEAAALKDAVFRDLAISAACAKQQHHRQKKKEDTP